MNNYIDIYDQMKNPLENEETLDKLVTAYSKRGISQGGFYNQLVFTTKKHYPKSYDPASKTKLYTPSFNRWKNNIVSLTKNEFLALKSKNRLDNDLIILRNYLKNIPDMENREEVNRFFSHNAKDKILENLMKKYQWTSSEKLNGWIYI